jgi:hypothetical protein
MHPYTSELFGFNEAESNTKTLMLQQMSNIYNQKGRIPTRDEYLDESSFTKTSIVKLFGSYTDMKNEFVEKYSPPEPPKTTQLSTPPPVGQKVSMDEDAGTGEASSVSTHIKTLDDLLKACEVDTTKWMVKNYTVNKWDVGAKIDGEVKVTQLFQVKALLERKTIQNSFGEILAKWQPPTANLEFATQIVKDASEKVFVPVLSDLHFGSASNEAYIFNGGSWSTEDTVRAVDKYSEKIISDYQRRNDPINKCIVVSLGDQLHSLSGRTSKGTQLKFDAIREEQFDYAMTSLTRFFTNLMTVFPHVEVYSVYGNHAYEIEMALFRALAAYFRDTPKISFINFSTRPAAFAIKNSLFIIDHGSDSEYKFAQVPNGAKRETHIQNLFLTCPLNQLPYINSKYFMMGHHHHWEHMEYNNFEFMMFGTTLGADEYAAANNWRNRPRQTSLIVDDMGVSEILHTFF